MSNLVIKFLEEELGCEIKPDPSYNGKLYNIYVDGNKLQRRAGGSSDSFNVGDNVLGQSESISGLYLKLNVQQPKRYRNLKLGSQLLGVGDDRAFVACPRMLSAVYVECLGPKFTEKEYIKGIQAEYITNIVKSNFSHSTPPTAAAFCNSGATTGATSEASSGVNEFPL